jgi:3-deoxy-manno-octulosonate cytidylyltransferase (CMP-KDO synthetase)
MSTNHHESGSDRIAEAVKSVNCDLVVNVQGDEPFTDCESLDKVISVFETDTKKEIDLASLMVHITDVNEIENPNTVKVIVDQRNFALYFSRSPIPYQRDSTVNTKYFKHKGVYAFRKEALLEFAKLPMEMLELSEKIECLRYLEFGKKIKMVESNIQGVEIDTPEDLQRAKTILRSNN